MENKENKKENKTGKYIYDKKLKKVVKISDDIVGIKKQSANNTPSCASGGGCCPSCGLN